MRTGEAFRKIVLILAYALILFVFSERLFWAFWRPEDSFPEAISTFSFYFVLACAFLVISFRARVVSVSGLVLVGLVYAYLTEGVVAGIFYDPVALFVALPWHILMSIFLGLFVLPRFLSTASLLKRIFVLIIGGVTYAVWVIGMIFEYGDTVTLERFMLNIFGSTLLLACGYALSLAISKKIVTFSLREMQVLGGIFVIYLFLTYGVTAFPPFLVLILLLVFVLNRLKKIESSEIASDKRENVNVLKIPSFTVGNYFLLFLVPIISSFIVAFAVAMNLRIETAFIFVITLFCGAIYLLAKTFFRHPTIHRSKRS